MRAGQGGGEEKREKKKSLEQGFSNTSKSIGDLTQSTWQKADNEETQVQRNIELLYELQHFNALVGEDTSE